MALNDFKDTNQGGGVLTVSNSNIGKGIKWNPATNQYEVALGDGLFINDDGLIQLKAVKPKIETFDNGTGVVKHRRAIIDYGGLIEVSGVIKLGWMSSKYAIDSSANINAAGNAMPASTLTAETNRLKSIYGQGLIVNRPYYVDAGVYSIQTGYHFNVAEIGISKVIYVGYSVGRGGKNVMDTERAWVIGDIDTLTTVVPISAHVEFIPGQTECSLSYTIKGIKA